MKHYKDANNQVYAYEADGSQDDIIPAGLTPITDAEADALRAAVPTVESVRADRDARIQAVAWRYERNAREVRLGLTPTDDIALLDKYVQALADVPVQKGFPAKVKWPVL